MRRTILCVALAAAAGGVGCASLGRGAFQEPIVNFRNARITGLGLSGGSVEIALSVYNPNQFRLDGTRLTYRLSVDSVQFGQGAYDQQFTVQERDSTVIRLPLTFTYAGIGELGRQLLQTGTVNYRVAGDLTVATPIGNFTRPYDQTGRFNTLSNSR